MEHVILTRLVRYMDNNNLFPHTMIGFRCKLSTQNIVLQIQLQIIDTASKTRDNEAILGLDLAKAFDNITHEAILGNLQGLGIGKWAYEYSRDFLLNRKARITIGGIHSDDIGLGSRGTPQRSVLSPLLFNVAMIGLQEKLEHSGRATS